MLSDVGEVGDAAGEVHGEAGRLRTLLAQMRPPPGPVRGRWSLGIGDVFSSNPATPARLRGVLGKLDRYGGVGIDEQVVRIDGQEIAWSDVTEIRTMGLVEYLLSGALQEQVRALPVPWFPGRAKLLEAVCKALLTVLFAAAKEQIDRQQNLRVPAEIRYRAGNCLQKVCPGVLATLILSDPAVSGCLLQTAAERNVAVVDEPSQGSVDAEQGGLQLRRSLNALESRLGQWRLDAREPKPSGGGPLAAPPRSSPDSADPIPASVVIQQGASPVSDPNEPLFPLPSNSSSSDSPTTGSSQSAGSAGHPWAALVPAHSDGDADGRSAPKRGIPLPLIIGAGVVLAVSFAAAFVAFSGKSDSDRTSSARTARESVPTGSWDGGEARQETPRASALPPIISMPDIYGEDCRAGFHLNGQSGWGTSAGRGSPETSCFFTRNVLLSYADQNGAATVERRSVTAPGSVPCPSTGARCAGDDFVLECAALGSEPWITCTGGRNARVFIY